MTIFVSVLLGLVVGLALLATVFLYAFRIESTKRWPAKSRGNYDVFDKDRGLSQDTPTTPRHSSYDHQDN